MTLPGGMMLIVMSGVYIPRVPPSILLAVLVSILLFLLFMILLVAIVPVIVLLVLFALLVPTLQQRPSHLFSHLDAVGPVLYMGDVFTLPAVP